jgi:hypothetical protein
MKPVCASAKPSTAFAAAKFLLTTGCQEPPIKAVTSPTTTALVDTWTELNRCPVMRGYPINQVQVPCDQLGERFFRVVLRVLPHQLHVIVRHLTNMWTPKAERLQHFHPPCARRLRAAMAIGIGFPRYESREAGLNRLRTALRPG